jgi:hypothetical protein
MQAIKTETRKARKEHRCDLCRGKIIPGEKYVYQFIVDGGDSWDFKMHEKCDYISQKLWNWFDPDEGLTSDYFEESLPDYSYAYVCPHCEYFTSEKECKAELNGGTDCIDRIYDRLQKYMLVKKGGRWDIPKWVEVERESEVGE